MKSSLQNILGTRGIMVIDGSMSTALENMGLDLNHRLWTARALAENPEQVKQVHINYFRAGADCGITCSYQASIPGLTGCGYTEAEAEVLIRRSVELFLEARDEWWEKEGRDAGDLLGQWRLTDTQYISFSGSIVSFRNGGNEVFGNFQHVGDSLFIQCYSIYGKASDVTMVENEFGFKPFGNIRVKIDALDSDQLLLSKDAQRWSLRKY